MFLFILIVFSFICFAFFLIAVGLFFYCKFTVGYCKNTTSLHGKTIVITGANGGIGLEAAKEFARRGARLIMPCRDQKKAQKAVIDIKRESGNADIRVFSLDLSDLRSVESFAQKLLDDSIEIDALCLNAGRFWTSTREESVDGFELVFATNHLGHFHLANLLTPLLKRDSRVILTSSMAYEGVRLNFLDLQHEKKFSYYRSYACSKLMNIYHMRELSKRLRKNGVTVNAFHPGLVQTDLFAKDSWYQNGFYLLTKIYGKSPFEGAQTLIYLVTDEKVAKISGSYFQDCKLHRLVEIGNDERAPKKLWEYSEKLLSEWKNLNPIESKE